MTKVLVKQRAALDEILQVAPTALTNLFHTYNPATGTLDTRTNVGENINNLTPDPAGALLHPAGQCGREHVSVRHAASGAAPDGPTGATGSPSDGAPEAGGERRPVPRRDRGGAAMRP